MIARAESTKRVLLVEDEAGTRELIRTLLEEEGYEVRAAQDGQEGLRAFFQWQPDLVILDIRMPRMDGWELLGRIREVASTPVLMLTALGQSGDVIRGLRGGADDYVVKPVGMAELAARVDAILRRTGPQAVRQEPGDDQPPDYRDAALLVDRLRHQVYLNGREVELSPQEFRLLATLVAHAGIVLSPQRLLDLCWKEGEAGLEVVRVYIGYLRKKLEDNPRQPRLIETVREFGYRYRPQTSQI